MSPWFSESPKWNHRFIHGLSIADAYIRTGALKHVLLIGSEVHSAGLDISTAGRDVTALFARSGPSFHLGALRRPTRRPMPADCPANAITATGDALQVPEPRGPMTSGSGGQCRHQVRLVEVTEAAGR